MEMTTNAEPISPSELNRGFKVSSLNQNEWRVECRQCTSAWSLNKQSSHPGNLLHLLNHEASHGEDLQTKSLCSDCGTPINVMGRDSWGGLHPGKACKSKLTA